MVSILPKGTFSAFPPVKFLGCSTGDQTNRLRGDLVTAVVFDD
jgi:hypothetical protein